jgi:hypothetical protein
MGFTTNRASSRVWSTLRNVTYLAQEILYQQVYLSGPLVFKGLSSRGISPILTVPDIFLALPFVFEGC